MHSVLDPFGTELDSKPNPSLFALEMEGCARSPEGLLSYVVGLAQAHCVSPRTLLRHLLSCSEEYRRLWSVSTLFERDIGTANGMGRYASMMVTLMGAGFDEDAQGMTFLPLAKLLPRNGEGFLVRRPRWCPLCLCEQARSCDRLYHPLTWSLDYYTVCHIHEVAMSEMCPACGGVQPFLPSYPSMVHCGCCGQSLIVGPPEGFLLDEFEVCEFSVWCAHALADLVWRRSALGKEGSLVELRLNIDRLCRRLTDGNRKQLCRQVGLQECALKGWMMGERPSMSVLLRLCFGVQVMPAAMFLPHSVELGCSEGLRVAVASQRLDRPRLGFRERERIKNLLDVIIADRGDVRWLSDIAQQIGLSRSALKYWFRDECRSLVLKKRANEDRRMLLKYMQDHALLRSIVQSLRAQKLHLSRWQVDQELRKHKVSLIRPDLFQALEKMRIS